MTRVYCELFGSGVAKEPVGFFDNLSEKQKTAALTYDGEENIGDPKFLRSTRTCPMTLTEAIAIYLTLANKSDRTPHETRAFAAAWGVILQDGERLVSNFSHRG